MLKSSRNVVLLVATAVLLLGLAVAGVAPVSAAPQEEVCFELVATLGGTDGTWSSSGLVHSGGSMTFSTRAAGWDSELGIPATLHKTVILTEVDGSITMNAQAKSALVEDDGGNPVPGYRLRWNILSGTGAYANLHGQGTGYGWADWGTWTFPVYLCGRAHYDARLQRPPLQLAAAAEATR